MGIRLIMGRSGSGKSTYLYDHVIRESIKNPNQRFFILVPDQFTMQAQKDIIMRHPQNGILNIEVLSFTRLAYRVLGETGGESLKVLDDAGKSLILRKVAANSKDELTVIGSNLKKTGYIHEVKSAVSEFMQYGIGEVELDRMIACSSQRKMLQYKLQDLKLLMKEFQSYIEDHYITTEDTMTRLAEQVLNSRLVSGSVFALDGFTGFTPVQWKVLRAIGKCAQEVLITNIIDKQGAISERVDEQNLFYMGQKMQSTLNRYCSEDQIVREKDIVLFEEPVKRYQENPFFAHLEASLFRYPVKGLKDQKDQFRLIQAENPKDEVCFIAEEINQLILEKGFRYQDIAVVTGDLAGYSHLFRQEFEKREIPCYLDQTRMILLNPFTEFIKSSVSVLTTNFTYESVFHFLRSGMLDITTEEIDLLENYVLEMGIRGKKKWSSIWSARPGSTTGKEEKSTDELLTHLNQIRVLVMQTLEPLLGAGKSVQDIILSLYQMIIKIGIQDKLHKYENDFKLQGDQSKAKEYAQIYRLVMQLFEQITDLLGEEEMGLKEFSEILDAGLLEIQVGTIPLSHDRVMIGDIERTRLNEIKILFFAGINDGIVPNADAKGGLISDVDRDFLESNQFELAPSPRMQMYIQRLYLYLNMTKPTEKLYLSFCAVSREGKTLRRGYLIGVIERLFPGTDIIKTGSCHKTDRIYHPTEGMEYLSDLLRDYAGGRNADEIELNTFLKLMQIPEYGQISSEKIVKAAFMQYHDQKLYKQTVKKLYGELLVNSVSRLERFAGCAYAHFLQYGLDLKQRAEYSFETSDLGTVYHNVLDEFANELKKKGIQWEDLENGLIEELMDAAVDEVTSTYGDTILFSTAQRSYLIHRIRRIMKRSAQAIRYQLKKGSFQPEFFEVPFSMLEELPTITVKLSETEKMNLRGRIDRIDLSSDEDIYVKVVDYKSGNKDFEPAEFYHGLQLQLLLYLNAAVDLVRQKQPDKNIVPAAALYYHIEDPILPRPENMPDQDAWEEEIHAKLKTKGTVNGRDDIVRRLDKTFEKKSDVIPVEYDRNGNLSKRSNAFSQQDFEQLLRYTNEKVAMLGREILSGKICVNPYEAKQSCACTYCDFRAVCKLDDKIPGFEKRKLSPMTKETLIEEINKKSSKEL